MTSERRFAANRLNAPKSRGPRSAAGKSVVSRNALRHGLAAVDHHCSVPASDIECLAKALCGNDNDAALFRQALTIAENELVLRAIAAQELAVIERLRDPSMQALAKGDNILTFLDARLRKVNQACDYSVELENKIIEGVEKLASQISPENEEEIMCQIDDLDIPVPSHIKEFLKVDMKERSRERDEPTAMEEAAGDLVRLDRYRRRAWSRQKKAVLAFANIKLMKQLDTANSTRS
jgi:hypothetical protein